MLIRATITLLPLLVACAEPLSTTEDEADQDSIASCDLPRYRCYPNRPGSDMPCELACGYPSHCRDYSSGEYIWCEVHPGQCLGNFRCCDPWGNPAWDTVCTSGLAP